MKDIKKVAIVLILSMILSTITACGNASAKNDGVRINSDGTVSEIGDSDDEGEDSDDSNDEIASDSSVSEDPENDFAEDDDSSLSSSVSTPSGDYVSDESFWDGDDKFDLKGFLEANGYRVDDWPTEPKDPDATKNYKAYYGPWMLRLNSGTGANMTLNRYEKSNNGTIENTGMRYETNNYPLVKPDDKKITVTGGTSVNESALNLMIIAIRSLKEYPDDEDPLSHYDVDYSTDYDIR